MPESLRARGGSIMGFIMALAIAHKRISRDEYLQGELCSEIRHEYVAGNVYAMSGGTLNHQRIAGNFLYLAKGQLAGRPCFPTGSDFKLRVPLDQGEEAFYYPDDLAVRYQVQHLSMQDSIRLLPLPREHMQLYSAFSRAAAGRYLQRYERAQAEVAAQQGYAAFFRQQLLP